MKADWTTPAAIKAQLERHWNQGRLLAAQLNCEPLFPLPLRFAKPDSNALSQRFEEVRHWIRGLEQESKRARGFGYEIEWTEVNHRQLGRNRVPAGIVVPSERDALRLLGKTREAESFRALAEMTVASFPGLQSWLSRRPFALLENAKAWERILAVLSWFRDHPHPGIYLRQLEIPGVDTKFIEARKGLLTELLDQILPAFDAAGARSFEQRYGLTAKPPRIRFRLLDTRQHICGLSDIATPAAQFSRFKPPVKHVFITENEINGLAFPDVPEGLVIFGLGYGVDCLAQANWLNESALYYWGDIDTHGFAMLDRLRARFPHAQSFLMDRETLIFHRSLWVREDSRYEADLGRLTPSERALFDELRRDSLAERVRLEQERIEFGRVRSALRAVAY